MWKISCHRACKLPSSTVGLQWGLSRASSPGWTNVAPSIFLQGEVLQPRSCPTGSACSWPCPSSTHAALSMWSRHPREMWGTRVSSVGPLQVPQLCVCQIPLRKYQHTPMCPWAWERRAVRQCPVTEIKAHCNLGSGEGAVLMAKCSLILGVFSRLPQSWERWVESWTTAQQPKEGETG